MNIPLYIGQRALKTSYEYQTDLNGNYQVNSAVGATHLFHSCAYHLEANLLYTKIHVESVVPLYRSYLGEVKFDLFRPIFFLSNSTIYLGAGNVHYTSTIADDPQEERGYLVGYGTYIGALRTYVFAKSILWEEFTQYQVGLKRQFKKWDAGLQWKPFRRLS